MSRLWVRQLLPHPCFPSHTTRTKGCHSKVGGLCVIGIAPWLRQLGPLRHFGKEPRQATAYRTLSPELSCGRTIVRKPFQHWNNFTGYQSNTGLTSDRGANVQVEDNLGADVSVKSDLDIRAEAVPTICRRSTSTDITYKNCHWKRGFQVCFAHDLKRFATRP